VLVVEDEYFIRAMITDELRGCGLKVIECATADEAMDVLNTRADISIIFTDIRLPGSIDGITLAKVANAHFPDVPVVLTSTELPNGFAAAHFVPKPYDPERVIRLLNDLLTGTSKHPHR
jgi:CheY-like chemotaxis protein